MKKFCLGLLVAAGGTGCFPPKAETKQFIPFRMCCLFIFFYVCVRVCVLASLRPASLGLLSLFYLFLSVQLFLGFVVVFCHSTIFVPYFFLLLKLLTKK